MSNLEKLARLVDKPPCIGNKYAFLYEDSYVWGFSAEMEFNFATQRAGYTWKQIKAKRDELSGKPKEWLYDWARFRAQDANGKWLEHEIIPVAGGDRTGQWSRRGRIEVTHQGEVLGDWKDTCEERVMEEWLPPVGTVCKAHFPTYTVGVVTITHQGKGVGCYKKTNGDEFTYETRVMKFTPIRTERETQLLAMKELCDKGTWEFYKGFAEALYDAGYLKGEL